MKLFSAAALTALLAAGCGTVDTKGLNDKADEQAGGDSSAHTARALTDEIATETATEATAEAEANDAATDEPAVEEKGKDLPAFLQVVKAARDYTRKLLGIDDSALKAFLAKVEAIRALATSPEEFEEKIASAKAEFETAMKAQKEVADKAREEHKAELDAIFDGTVKVFAACGAPQLKMGKHQPRPPKGPKPPKGKGRGPGHGEGHGKGGPRPPKGEGDGPRTMIGSGELEGGMGDLHGQILPPPPPPGGERPDLTQDATKADSAECKSATDTLSALL